MLLKIHLRLTPWYVEPSNLINTEVAGLYATPRGLRNYETARYISLLYRENRPLLLFCNYSRGRDGGGGGRKGDVNLERSIRGIKWCLIVGGLR